MKTFARIFVSALVVCTPLMALAESTVSVDVPDHCTVIDSDGVAHAYSGQYFGICALQAAIDTGAVTGVQFSNAFPAFGLFVTAIGSVTADSNSQYWALFQNGGFASLGLSQLPVSAGDSIVLELHDFSDNFLGSRLTLNIHSLVNPAPAPLAPGSGGVWMHAPFDVPAALQYLESVQSPDGSFGSPMLTDWAAIAAGLRESPTLRTKLIAYELVHPVISTIVTENERHAMALEALGINPYSGTPVDYITPIVNSFDDTQIGDAHLDNDDIFALFPLLHAGYTPGDDIIKKTVAFILSAQQENGSWDASVDMTAAAIQTLTLMPDTGEVRYAISKATGYLHGKQLQDGSFGDPYSSSWMLQAIGAMNGTSSDWQQHALTPDYYLSTLQQADGGVMASSTNDRIWATSYAIPGIRRATWGKLLSSFEKPAPAASSTPATTPEATSAESISAFYVAPQNTEPVLRSDTAPAIDTDTSVETNTAPETTAEAQAASAALSVDSASPWQYVLLLPFLALLAALAMKYWKRLDA